MVALNRIVNILTFVAALVAFGFTLVLHQRRVELRTHSETLASALAQVSQSLSTNSGTTQHERLTETGLGWQRFHELRNPQTGDIADFQKVLDEAVAQADALRQQRDMLAGTLAKVGERFEVDGASAENLQLLADSAQAATELSEKLNAVDRRDRNTARVIAALGRDIGLDTESETVLDIHANAETLDELANYVRDMDMRSAQLADTMAQIVDKIDRHEFETNPDRLRNADYAGEMAALLNDFEAINEALIDFEQAEAELVETRQLFEKTLVALDDSNQNLSNLKIRNDNLAADVRYWKGKYDSIVVTPPPEEQPPTRSVASVIEVNYDWNYVIIDMGAEDRLQPNTELTVGRENEFICSVRVSKVYDRHAVAEVLPKLRQGEVLAGDRVFF
jgi:hypothetical protein